MAGSWRPCRTEAKARSLPALQNAQQSAESEEMGGMSEDPKEDRTELPRASGRQTLRSQQAHAGSGSFCQRPAREEDYATL